MKEETKQYRYGTATYRLHAGTVKRLKEIRQQENVSWNKLFFKLIKMYEKHNKNKV